MSLGRLWVGYAPLLDGGADGRHRLLLMPAADDVTAYQAERLLEVAPPASTRISAATSVLVA
jgi:hypothetical protein